MAELRRDQKILLVIAAIFFVPLLIAWVWFYNVDTFRPEGSVAKGELIHPARALGEFSFPRVRGEGSLDAEHLRGRWAMVYLGGPRCDDTCRETLYESRQVHVALGRDAIRVQRVYLLVGGESLDDQAFMDAEHRDMIIVRVEAGSPFLSFFEGAGRLYLVDPLGNLMMSYPPEASGRDLMDDLKRLFRVSRVG